MGTVLRLRARGSGRKVSPRPPPPPFSAGRSVTRTEVERSRPRGLGRRGPERPAAGGRGPRGAADRTHGKAGSPGGAPASRAWAPSLLFTSPPAAGRRPSSWGHRRNPSLRVRSWRPSHRVRARNQQKGHVQVQAPQGASLPPSLYRRDEDSHQLPTQDGGLKSTQWHLGAASPSTPRSPLPFSLP